MLGTFENWLRRTRLGDGLAFYRIRLKASRCCYACSETNPQVGLFKFREYEHVGVMWSSLAGRAQTQFTIEFFASARKDEGRVFLDNHNIGQKQLHHGKSC